MSQVQTQFTQVKEKAANKPNALFIEWLTQWKNAASKHGSKMEFVYAKALKSLRQHPEELKDGQACRVLKGFGEKICSRIDEQLKKYKKEHGIPEESNSSDSEVVVSSKSSRDCVNVFSPQRKSGQSLITDLYKKQKRPHVTCSPLHSSPLRKRVQRRKADYVPAKNSGAYAILLALYKAYAEDGLDFMGKNDLQQAAQVYTNSSMTVPTLGTHYTAFNSMRTLISKKLVEKEVHRQTQFKLTENGKELALKLYKVFCEDQGIPLGTKNRVEWTDSSDDEEEPLRTTDTSRNRLTFKAGTFEIVLCVDSREQTSGVSSEARKATLLLSLQNYGIKVEMRTLPVGDFAWIVREKENPNTLPYLAYAKELVLDTVIERKRIDDLASSIRDNRFEEQKFRLKQCGVRKPSYLIEGMHWKCRNLNYGLPFDSLMQATINADVDGFTIKHTADHKETVQYLATMTKYLQSFYQEKTLKSAMREELISGEATTLQFMTFSEFNTCATKSVNFTAREMFLKHLLQIRGISVDKAKIVTESYPTLSCLMDAYSICESEKEKQQLLSKLKCGNSLRNFGPKLSKTIYLHYNKL